MSLLIQNIINQAISIPIATAVAFSYNKKIYCGGYSNSQSIFDLASLTKIVGTTLAMCCAISDGYIRLDEEPFVAWPGVRVRDLLAHTSGLPAHVKFYDNNTISNTNFIHNKYIIFDLLFREKAYKQVGARVYSDLNFLALGLLLERRLRKDLYDIFVETWDKFNIKTKLNYYKSAGLITNYNSKFTMPTGVCLVREQRVTQQVHDLNCYFLGGIAGHAGLFGSLLDLENFGEFFLRAYTKPQTNYEALIQYFARHNLGFDSPKRGGSVCALSPESFGHFGFTGTSLWVDPHAKIFISLLTNRVDSSLHPAGIFWLRTRLHKLY
jgi:CubicO group peptidase (beta-lactamase class C family)